MTPEEFMEETIRFWAQCNCNKSFGGGMRAIMYDAGLLKHTGTGWAVADAWEHTKEEE